jgi:Sec-independent protein translocase protein TatA
MFDDFREWLSDNLRYILLIVAALLLLVIGIFAVKLVTHVASPKKSTSETQKVQQTAEENESESDKSTQDSGEALVRNQQEVLDLVTRYYTARADKDYDALAELCETFDDDVRADLEAQDGAIESYDNIITYSKAGLTEGAYVVYVYFDAKITGITTEAPNLRELYLITDTEGQLLVGDKDSDASVRAYVEQMRTASDVQALISDVKKKMADAEAADESLKAFVESDTTVADDSDTENDNEDADTAESASGTMQVTTGVNVRGTPSADGTLYGTLYQGMTVEVLEDLDSGWSKIRYTTNGTTIEGYVMTQYLTEAQ